MNSENQKQFSITGVVSKTAVAAASERPSLRIIMKHRSVMFSVLCRIVFLSWFMSAFAARGAVVPQLKLTLPSTLTVSEDATSSLEMIVSDPTGSLQDLLLSAASSDQSVLPASGIVASGVGMRRQLVLSPLKPGTTLLTVTIRDAATHSVVQTCPVTVKPRIPQGLIMDHGENLARQLYLSVVVSELPQPQIRLVFSADAKAHNYTVYRRGKNVKAWGAPIAHLPGSATEFVDQNISPGEPYEFRVDKDSTNPVKWSAYLYAGVRTSLAEARGKIALVVDNTYAADLKPELDRLTQDLVGDGWQALRHDVSRDSTTTYVKGLLKTDYAADPGQVKAVFLFGHVPIAYSGFSIPDGHFSRPFPADGFYGDMEGLWKDDLSFIHSAYSPENRNYPNDGNYDENLFPADIKLEVGRVDLNNMPAFLPKTEKDLLRQYLNKDHQFRHKQFNLGRRGLLSLGPNKMPFDLSESVISDKASLLGLGQIDVNNDFVGNLRQNAYLWAYAANFGNYRGLNNGMASTDDFADGDPKAVFTQLLGSWFGEWQVWDDFLRAPLCGSSYTLTAAWGIGMNPLYHQMALGETIGFSTRVSQIAGSQVHNSVMGDPTLRLHPVAPINELVATSHGTDVSLRWKEPLDPVEGYCVYRAANANGPFTRITSSLLRALAYTDAGLNPGNYTYMVRAVKLEVSASGTYLNPSQGMMVDVTVSTIPDTQPPTIAFVSPVKNGTVCNPTTVHLHASDDRQVSRADVLVDGTVAATLAQEPYSTVLDMSSFADGAHMLQAKVYDTAGNSAIAMASVTLVKNDTVPPAVRILSPADGANVWGQVGIRAEVTDNASVDHVELWVDGVKKKTLTTGPYLFGWRTFEMNAKDSGSWTTLTQSPEAKDGSHRITVKGYDKAGNVGQQNVAVRVDSRMARISILQATPKIVNAQAGDVVTLAYHWQGGPALGMADPNVFVHLVDSQGNLAAVLDDFEPVVPTMRMTGETSFSVRSRIPALSSGRYKIMAGLYSGTQLVDLLAGPGVVSDGGRRYQIGMLTVLPDRTNPVILDYGTYPAEGQKIYRAFPLFVATRDNFAVSRIELLVDGNVVQFDAKPVGPVTLLNGFDDRRFYYTHQLSWDPLQFANGPHTLAVRAYDPSTNFVEKRVVNSLQAAALTIKPATPGIITAKPGDRITFTHHMSGGPVLGQALVRTYFLGVQDRRSLDFAAGDLNVATLRGQLQSSSQVNTKVLQKLGLTSATVGTVAVEGWVAAFNRILRMKDFFDVFPAATFAINKEALDLLARAKSKDASLTDLDYKRLNRALLQAMYLTGFQRDIYYGPSPQPNLATWSGGDVFFSQTILVPASAAKGTYPIYVVLNDSACAEVPCRNPNPIPMKTAPGVETQIIAGDRYYRIAELTVE